MQFGEGGDVEPSHKKLYAALAAEFLGMLLFALYGGEARDSAAAYGNGLALAVLVYATANVSGGHLNPAVTLGTIISGHMGWRRGLLYMAAQFLGGIVGERGSVGASWEAGWLARRAYKGWSGSSGGGGQLGGESPLHAARRLRLPHARACRRFSAGVLFQVALIPEASVAMGNEGPVGAGSQAGTAPSLHDACPSGNAAVRTPGLSRSKPSFPNRLNCL